jgi:hypothetical protein
MAADASTPPPERPGRDLPPVQPPSGRFIAQLFLVPGLIVLGVVCLVLAINYLFVGGHSADQFLLRLDNANPDIRWRGANDLAQVLKRKESVNLKCDVGFALELIERLERELDALRKEETAIAAQLKGPADESGKSFQRLEPQRNLVNFLAACLGDFHFAAGMPTLCDIIARDDSPDVLHNTMRRRQALWALANLGENTKGVTGLRLELQNLIFAKLRTEVGSDIAVRRRAAKNALRHLGAFPNLEDAELVHVDQVLAQAAGAEDRFLREQVAFAFNFWDGPQAEPTLLKLARDDGFGTLLRTPELP